MKTLIFNKSVACFWVCLTLTGFSFFGQITAAQAQTPAKVKESPLHITSDQMVAQKDTSMIEFTGNVKATLKDSTVLADSIKIYFVDTDQDAGDPGKVKKIVSAGNVKYTAGDRKAIADKAVYTFKDEVLILTGTAPKLITGSSFVTGKKITLFRLQDKVLVESDGSKRVEAVFNPEDNIIVKQ